MKSKCSDHLVTGGIALLLSSDIRFMAMVDVDISPGILLVYKLLGETFECFYLYVIYL